MHLRALTACFLFSFHLPIHLTNLFDAHTFHFIARFSFMFCGRHICRITLFIVYSIFLSIKFYEWNCAMCDGERVRSANSLKPSFCYFVIINWIDESNIKMSKILSRQVDTNRDWKREKDERKSSESEYALSPTDAIRERKLSCLWFLRFASFRYLQFMSAERTLYFLSRPACCMWKRENDLGEQKREKKRRNTHTHNRYDKTWKRIFPSFC